MKESLLLFVCLHLIFFGCAEKKPELLVDELYISKHVVAPQLRGKVKFNLENNEKPAQVDTIQTIPFFLRGINISHSCLNPKLILHITKDGKLKGFVKIWEKETEGYFETIVPDSMISYFNDQLYKMRYKNYKKTFYSDMGDGAYSGSEYFVYIRNGKNIKMDFGLEEYQTPNNIVTMIDSMYNYMSKVPLKNSPSSYFRKDTLIVLETEAYWDSTESWWPY